MGPDARLHDCGGKCRSPLEHAKDPPSSVQAEVVCYHGLAKVEIYQEHLALRQTCNADRKIAGGDALATTCCWRSHRQVLPTLLVHFLKHLGAQHVVIAPMMA